MSKKFKSQASSARAASATSSPFAASTFGSSGFQTSTSALSYITEQPDLRNVSDANVVVSLRNLGKKDARTKSKALEELQEFVSASSDAIEQGFLEAWVKIYPRTSIDNSRRVRQLAHILQGSITHLAGKRIVPHLSKIVGAWLAGLFDPDKAVARAAQEALSVAFSNEEKRRALWKVYKDALLSHAEDSIIIQTRSTLSDERNTSKEDADAKHVRVVGSGINLLANIIEGLPSNIAGTDYDNAVQSILLQKRLWEFVYHEDAYLRRATSTLAVTCVKRISNSLDWKVLSLCFIGKALHSSQLGSAKSFSDALLTLTNARPEIWTEDYSSKTSAGKRLRQFVAKGSQGGPEAVWINIGSLIKSVPKEVIIVGQSDESDDKDLEDLLEALRKGVASADESRTNLSKAWAVYSGICFSFVNGVQNERSRASLIEKYLRPIVVQSVTNDPNSQAWTLPTSAALTISCDILLGMLRANAQSAVKQIFSLLNQDLIDSMKLSLAETSRDHQASQNAVISKSSRHFRLQQRLFSDKRLQDRAATDQMLNSLNEALMKAAIEILKSRSGKPYCAASVLLDITSLPGFDSKDSALTSFLDRDASTLLQSPSADLIVAVALAAGHSTTILSNHLAQLSLTDNKSTKALCALLSGLDSAELDSQTDLNKVVIDASLSDTYDDRETQILFKAFQNTRLRESSTLKQLLVNVLAHLSPETSVERQSSGLALMDKLTSDRISVAMFNSPESIESTLPLLIILGDSSESVIASTARSVYQRLRQSSTDGGASASSTLSIISGQFSGEGAPISVGALVELAKEFLESTTPQNEQVSGLIPSASQWEDATHPQMCFPKPPSLSLFTPLQGILALVNADNSTTHHKTFPQDADGYSLLFRMASYLTTILRETNLMNSLGADERRVIYSYYPAAVQLINEKITDQSANTMWMLSPAMDMDEAVDLLSAGNALLQSWLQIEGDEISEMITYWLDEGHHITGHDSLAYYRSLVFADLISRYIDIAGPSLLLKQYENEIRNLHKSSQQIQAAAILVPCREHFATSLEGRKLLNDLVAAVTTLKSLDGSGTTLASLYLLNILLAGNEESLDVVQSQRLVFLMKTLVSLLPEVTDNHISTSEVLKLLSHILPALQDIYGNHWQQIIDGLLKIFNNVSDSDNNLPALNSGLRLYARLQTLSQKDDVNEDLVEAWQSTKPSLEQSLLRCLDLFAEPAPSNQARQVTSSLLCRLVSSIRLADATPLLPLLMSPDELIQSTAYGLLHQYLPMRQEQLSLDLALEKEAIHITPELLGVVAKPSSDPAFKSDRSRSDTRPYLLMWNLIFDHFPNASYKLRECYNADIKSSNALPPLLDLICEILRITNGRPVDASKFDLQNFDVGKQESDSSELNWLAAHLYYNCLLFLPSQVKDWFIDRPNRIKSPLESWTQKYISASIINASLAAVDNWASAQSDDPDDRSVAVKSSPRGSELVASIAVDPESPPIALVISLPGSYPLVSPIVTSRTRVGVSERNWQSWLRTVQIIIFSTGSIIEGLIAFRRNVQAALKGQSECAICYSIIGTDMKTPDKRCGTCRKAFHGSCLFRWFKSSNSSSCPLCRNNFNYA